MSKESSLKASYFDGFFASIMIGLIANYITPFGLLLGATSFHIGLLTSFPLIASSFVQLWSTELVKKVGSRLKLISATVFLQATALLLVPVVILLPERLQIPNYIFLITLGSLFTAVSTPAWASLMSDTVEKNNYGKYFAWRGKVLGTVVLVTNLLAGFFLFLLPDKFLAFVILLLVAGISRIFSGIYVGKMDDIPVAHPEKKDFTYIEFIRRLPQSNFVKFVLFVSLINFTTFIAGPFFAVYMLNDLKFDYSTYTLIISIAGLATLITLPFWGKLADRYGNVKIIKASALFVPILPVLWIFSKNPFYLLVINAFAGYLWAGFNLAAVNYIFDSASPELRTKCFAYFNFTNGIFICLGAFLGGFLALRLPGIVFGSKLLTIFCVSGLGTAIVNFFMLNSFHEVRKVDEITEEKMLYTILGASPELSLTDRIFRRK